VTSKNDAQRLQKTHEGLFFGVHVWEQICRQKSHKSFSGKFGGIQAKILRTPQNFACSYTYGKRYNERSDVVQLVGRQHIQRRYCFLVKPSDLSA